MGCRCHRRNRHPPAQSRQAASWSPSPPAKRSASDSSHLPCARQCTRRCCRQPHWVRHPTVARIPAMSDRSGRWHRSIRRTFPCATPPSMRAPPLSECQCTHWLPLPPRCRLPVPPRSFRIHSLRARYFHPHPHRPWSDRRWSPAGPAPHRASRWSPLLLPNPSQTLPTKSCHPGWNQRTARRCRPRTAGYFHRRRHPTNP
mmetsp:Transcript_11334/g.31372  ORF Transcript_11334/g.31372 Transcript_11334/m.31372 type:complete len:201 (-) Transcript_11334:240-842(-)